MKFIIFTEIPQIQYNKENIVKEADKIAAKIMEVIGKISSPEEIQTLTHVGGTNVIELDTRWKGSKLKRNLKIINNIQGCSSIMLDYNPVNEVEDAVRIHDFFKAYSLGVTLFESYANRILKKFLGADKMKNIGNDRLENTSILSKMILLYSNDIIETRIYNDAVSIIRIRNRVIVHAADRTKRWDEKDLVPMTQYVERIVVVVEKLRKIES